MWASCSSVSQRYVSACPSLNLIVPPLNALPPRRMPCPLDARLPPPIDCDEQVHWSSSHARQDSQARLRSEARPSPNEAPTGSPPGHKPRLTGNDRCLLLGLQMLTFGLQGLTLRSQGLTLRSQGLTLGLHRSSNFRHTAQWSRPQSVAKDLLQGKSRPLKIISVPRWEPRK
jgi:hypothetical protein